MSLPTWTQFARRSLSFQFDGARILILDQTLLPREERWVEVPDEAAMVEAIQKLRVRGAPLIGLAAAYALALGSVRNPQPASLLAQVEALRTARPTAVNLMVCMDRMRRAVEADAAESGSVSTENLFALAARLFDEDRLLCSNIAKNGAALINDGDQILTHCNTGGLATAGDGTAIGILREAHLQGKQIHVWVDETRPLLQGGRLTTWEMAKYGIPYTLLTDSMAAVVMQKRLVSKVLVGADRIALNGDFANKVGTYGLSVSCRHHRIPLIVAAPYTTIDFTIATGDDIEIENRDAHEVRSDWAPSDAPVFNPAFDVTPAANVDYWVFDRAVYSRQDVQNGAIARLKVN